jgi:hypothetical protein
MSTQENEFKFCGRARSIRVLRVMLCVVSNVYSEYSEYSEEDIIIHSSPNSHVVLMNTIHLSILIHSSIPLLAPLLNT